MGSKISGNRVLNFQVSGDRFRYSGNQVKKLRVISLNLFLVPELYRYENTMTIPGNNAKQIFDRESIARGT